MNFSIYLPQKAESTKLPVIYWLSGKKILLLYDVSWKWCICNKVAVGQFIDFL